MSYSVEYLPSKEEIFLEGDNVCREKAEFYKKYGGKFIDEDFPPTRATLGVLKDIETGELDKDELDNEWIPPAKFSNFTIYRRNNYGKYLIWNDPQPFHVCQGRLGDCYFIAAIMTLTQKRKLLEELIPRNNYTMDSGVVQVRLFIDGKWQVIITDYLLPHAGGFERFAKMPKKQAWVAFVEKAYAKTKGTYGATSGGNSDNAFTVLTGCMSYRHYIDKDTNRDILWADLIKLKAADYLLAAGTPDQVDTSKEKRWYDRHMISDCHAYALLDFVVQDGHRLIHLGSNSTLKWNGKWSDKPGYDEAILKKWSVQDRELSDKKTFWMELDDFLHFFYRIYVGEFHEGWSEIRLKQKVKRKAQDDFQVLRLDIKRRCGVAFEVSTSRRKTFHKQNLFLNIHRSNSDNHFGELVHSGHKYDSKVSTGAFHLDPGTYLVVLASCGNQDEMENDWVIRSATPFTQFGSSFQFVFCPFSIPVQSVQQMILKYGKAENHEKDKVIIYTWYGAQSCFMMVDNLRNSDFLRVKGTVNKDNVQGEVFKHLSFGYFSYPVPPMSRMIVARYEQEKYGQPRCEVKLDYSISFRFVNMFNACDYHSFGSDLEAAVPLEV